MQNWSKVTLLFQRNKQCESLNRDAQLITDGSQGRKVKLCETQKYHTYIIIVTTQQ